MDNPNHFGRIDFAKFAAGILLSGLDARTIATGFVALSEGQESGIDFIDKIGKEAWEFRLKKQNSGKKGGLAKASTAIAVLSSAIAEPSIPLASSSSSNSNNRNNNNKNNITTLSPEKEILVKEIYDTYPDFAKDQRPTRKAIIHFAHIRSALAMNIDYPLLDVCKYYKKNSDYACNFEKFLSNLPDPKKLLSKPEKSEPGRVHDADPWSNPRFLAQ